MLVGGLSYDRLRYPENIGTPPFSDQEQTTERFSPKVGIVWDPVDSLTVRGAYTRSLGGVSLDQSIRLEPTQVAGFNQAFRSFAPESVAGANAGARFETYNLSIEYRPWKNTYVSAGGEILESKLPRVVGSYTLDPMVGDFVFASSLSEEVRFRERSIGASIDQLLGTQVALGASYRLTDSDYRSDFAESPSLVVPGGFQPIRIEDSVLHQVSVRSAFNHPCGFFSHFRAAWYKQSNTGYEVDMPGDSFWQLDAFAGYRFAQRRAQFTVGILNLADQDYRLNPLTFYHEMPRERTFFAKLDISL